MTKWEIKSDKKTLCVICHYVVLKSSPGLVLPGFHSAGPTSTIAVSLKSHSLAAYSFTVQGQDIGQTSSVAKWTQQPLKTQWTPHCPKQEWKAHANTGPHSQCDRTVLFLIQKSETELWMSCGSSSCTDSLGIHCGCVVLEIQAKGFSFVFSEQICKEATDSFIAFC